MKVIIAGSREIVDLAVVTQAMKESNFIPVEIISGRARGVDQLGEEWARNNNIPIKMFPANWDKFGKGAGYIRNQQMAEYADALVAVWDGKSRGTANMIAIAKKMNLRIYVKRINE